jgi:triosephosphate isomerase (TIM)
MAERARLVAGNWKMNGLRAEGAALAQELASLAAAQPLSAELLVCPPFTLLDPVGRVLDGSRVALGAQDCHAEAKGAHTGDIGAEMLRDLGCRYVILGHSERRRDHGESDEVVHDKIGAAWRAGLAAILCVGETREEREAGRAEAVVAAQLAGSMPPGADGNRLVIAYEPVWAIGTGLTPTSEDIARMHRAIRARIPAGVRILYGGSVNPGNAAAIFAIPDVDGALVGGASLKSGDFWAIARAAG